jgi:two-component system OmpR family response regulator
VTSPRRGLRVLLVDDAADVRMLLQVLLELDGWTVGLASDGRTGLAAARDERPDVVVLDVQLPGLDGPEVLRAMRRHPETASTPVVFLTGGPAADDEALLALGARGVLRKPFDAGTFGLQLAALL